MLRLGWEKLFDAYNWTFTFDTLRRDLVTVLLNNLLFFKFLYIKICECSSSVNVKNKHLIFTNTRYAKVHKQLINLIDSFHNWFHFHHINNFRAECCYGLNEAHNGGRAIWSSFSVYFKSICRQLKRGTHFTLLEARLTEARSWPC